MTRQSSSEWFNENHVPAESRAAFRQAQIGAAPVTLLWVDPARLPQESAQ